MEENIPPVAVQPPLPSLVVAADKSIKPVHIDGALYVIIGVTGSLLASCSTDFAEQNISPLILFWLKTFVEALLAGLKPYSAFGINPPPVAVAKS